MCVITNSYSMCTYVFRGMSHAYPGKQAWTLCPKESTYHGLPVRTPALIAFCTYQYQPHTPYTQHMQYNIICTNEMHVKTHICMHVHTHARTGDASCYSASTIITPNASTWRNSMFCMMQKVFVRHSIVACTS